MLIDLHRSFSEFTEAANERDDLDWNEYLGLRHGSLAWSALHEKPLSVVLGEAGIGKTIEFKQEVARLTAAEKTAFFLPLNQLADPDSWLLMLTGRESDYSSWVESDELGYFFLDAVDEARLKSHADFEKALLVVQRELAANFARVRIAISSRVTDWAASSVQSAVQSLLAKPIERALAAKSASALPVTNEASTTLTIPQAGEPAAVEAYVVTLDALSIPEAHRCATALGLADTDRFWAAVSDGDYEFMATRPLDLRWMVELWNQRSSLGTYLELIEVNISNRLREVNPSYETAGEVLSVDQLHLGAMELAAAAEFGACAFFTLEPTTVPSTGELASHTALTDWPPTEVRRLLATAVFDEASYGRVKFHHRSIREYLAAQWVAKQLEHGVPLQRLQGLFAGRPFGEPVLVSSRRAVLSWLAAINVKVREWVVGSFPEILFYEGDPQSWDRPSVDKAFANYIEASKRGLQLNWFNSPSEYMRVGRALSPGKVASVLSDVAAPPQVRRLCFQLARHAKLDDCAAIAFAIYRNITSAEWERGRALDVLELIATPEQRAEVLADLKSGALRTNELAANALPVTDWKSLAVQELSGIFSSTHSEAEFGSGPMVRVVKEDLLPAADLTAATLLLGAVMASLPRPVAGRPFARFPESDRPERAWLLDTLPDCFERVLELLPAAQPSTSAVCLEAAERIEALRNAGFTDRDEFNRLHKAIVDHADLRWRIALAIARSEDIRHSVSRLTWGSSCLVSFDVDDLPELTSRANDSARPADEREIWFSVAAAVAFRLRRGRERAAALRALCPLVAGSTRAVHIASDYRGWRGGAKTNREWQMEERHRKAKLDRDLEDYRVKLQTNLPDILSGVHTGWLQSLLRYSFNRSTQHDYSDVNFEAMATSLSLEIARAFKEGLKTYWPSVTPPNPSDYSNGQVPWVALIALAGLRQSLCNEDAIATLSPTIVAKAAQLAVWELNGPPVWFEALACTHRATVEAALVPWVIVEAQAPAPGNGIRGALEMVLRCSSDVRKGLVAQLAPMALGGQIVREDTLKVVVLALREDGLLSQAMVGTLCQSKLDSLKGTNGRIDDMVWFRIWMEEDAPAAWAWFCQHLAGLTGETEAQVSALASSLVEMKWLKMPLTQPAADVLLSLHKVLCSHPSNGAETGEDEDSQFFGPPTKRLRELIPNVLVGVRGHIGRQALLALLDKCSDSVERSWLIGRLAEHAAQEAAQYAAWSVVQLQSIGSPFSSPPKTEAQLFEQVIARLEEIRKNLEEGPFSERDLFSLNTPEKFLQRWLAAKFSETQNRRFSVHREEEVDDDKQTDIQLSCPAGNICVEIKPVDAKRGYSAASLTGTLKTQIVGQYLKGMNSSRGILVLMQLDKKTWNIPGGLNGQSFPALVKYLEAQAETIKRNSEGVNELVVFGMRCVV